MACDGCCAYEDEDEDEDEDEEDNDDKDDDDDDDLLPSVAKIVIATG